MDRTGRNRFLLELLETALKSVRDEFTVQSGGSTLLRASAVLFALTSLMTAFGASAFAGAARLERSLPMHFTWYACEPKCEGWIGAAGIVTGDTLKSFHEFARGRDLDGATVVLDSNGGSVNDAIALGRRWREIGLRTTVGSTVTALGERSSVTPQAWCESMCVFLLLSGKVRYVPEEAHVRVHQIWMTNRIEDAEAATYTAQDLMIVQRDIGKLAKYTFDMGGAGELLSLSLEVPPWESLHELSPPELQMTNLVNTHSVADVLPDDRATDSTVASQRDKSVADPALVRSGDDHIVPLPKSTNRAETALSGGGGPATLSPAK